MHVATGYTCPIPQRTTLLILNLDIEKRCSPVRLFLWPTSRAPHEHAPRSLHVADVRLFPEQSIAEDALEELGHV